MLTLRDLIRDLDVRVLAGESGLDMPVRWVHISELPDPTPWLSGGELLLTTGLALGDEDEQRKYVARLAAHQLAGLGVGTGFEHDEIPPALLEEAAACEFPVFEVPYELPFIAVTEAAFTQLVNEQYGVLRRALAAHERLERIVLSERGLEALVGTLSNLVGGSVHVFDGRGEPLAERAFRVPLDEDAVAALRAELHEHSGRRDGRAFAPELGGESGRALALPVVADEGPRPAGAEAARAPEAWLVAVKDVGALSDLDRLTLHQAVTIVALELLRRRVADDTERRLGGDVLAGVVNGELTGPELTRRLEPFGLAERIAAIVAIRPDRERRAPERFETAFASALRDEATPGLVASTGPLTCAFVPGLPEEELFQVAGRAAARLAASIGAPVRVGAGRAVAGGDARRSFHEARCAVEAVALCPPDSPRPEAARSNGARTNGARTNGNSSAHAAAPVATYRDLGSFQLLLSLQDDEALRLFCDSILAPIETSEGHYGGELMRSLEAFIEENGQWERAAKRLYCHRHTLRYRIRRVEELTGRDLHSARDRIEFWLALRGRELVS
jgi:purine catabolism regulator